jgi:hypothetical protein
MSEWGDSQRKLIDEQFKRMVGIILFGGLFWLAMFAAMLWTT